MNKGKIIGGLIDIAMIITFISISFVATTELASLDAFFPQKLINPNKIVLIEKTKDLKVVYINSQKEKIELNYNIIQKGQEEIIKVNKTNFYDYFQDPFGGGLKAIDILKANSSNLQKEFEEGLNGNFYIGYLDQDFNNFYIFAHNGTLGINGGILFYKLQKGDKITYLNSLIGNNQEFIVDERILLKKKDFIEQFTTNTKTFKDYDTIYLITCYPNYKSTERLILKLKRVN